MKLQDRLTLCPGEVFHFCRPETKRSRRHLSGRRLIKLVSHADIEGSGDHRHMFYLRMPVRLDLKAAGNETWISHRLPTG
jgi:hypothetical protein